MSSNSGGYLVCSLAFASALLATGCERVLGPGEFQPIPDVNLPTPDANGDQVYFASFESTADIVGWQAYGSIRLAEDAPEGGGIHSLHVSGGCIYPHAQRILPPLDRAAHLVLRAMGKNTSNGGGIMLRWAATSGSEHAISVGVTDTAWTTITSDDILFVPAGIPVQLELAAGGIMYSTMLVEWVEILRVESY
ncbi:hypothetical protein ACFLZR_00275 [Candidatus Neomarinimicrobiota bacterium]